MASSPELESFDITEDDLQNEFNPNRRTFRMSKHQATYGMWADDSDEDERPAFGKTKKQSRDYTASMNFVSAGIKVGDKIVKEGEEEEGENNITDSDEEPVVQAASHSNKAPRRGYFPVSKGGSAQPDGMGTWEKHTRGIGQKLLEKMGHVKGKGLGKRQQGITTPVEAKKRMGKGAVGFHGTERTERSLKDFPVQKASDEEEDQQFTEEVAQWKKTAKGDKKKKIKYRYKTVDELISSGGKKLTKREKQSVLSKVKVIDMTGKEQRVLSGYHALSHKHDRPDEEDVPSPASQTADKKAFDMPELLHNLDLLVDLAEQDIINSDRKSRYEADLVVNLKHEEEKLDAVCEQEEKQIDTLKQVLELIEQLEKRTAADCAEPLTLDGCVDLFKQLQSKYYEEYKLYELSSLAVALVFPLMRAEFAGWDVLRRPRHGIPTMTSWRGVLDGMGQPLLHDQTYMDPYDRLVWEVWMPEMRSTISSKWSVRCPDDLLEALEAWMPILPDWVLSNILEQLVFPKLQTEVESWNPLTDTMPIHAWLHPWLPLMGTRLEPLYGPIRHKLATALTNWHPSDNSAKLILQPWHKVFNPGHMEAFLVKNIVPKLALCMQEFLINPHEQHLDGWHWVMSWLDLVPKHCIVSVLEKHFFPKWLKVLTAWLTSTPNYDEVTKWYRGWKTQFSDQLLADPTVKEQFNKALTIMNRAVTGQVQPGARENVAYLASTERRRDYDTQSTYERREYDVVRGATASGSVPTSFKDLVEKRAEEYGILFVPQPGKLREAKQIYRFGNMQIYFDRNVVFLLEQPAQIWVPVSLNSLIDRAK